MPSDSLTSPIHIDVLSLFPDWFEGPLTASLLGRARSQGLVRIDVHDLRRWGTEPHRSVDDTPFGGGAGMLLTAGPFFEAVEELYGSLDARPRTLVMTPRGRRLDQHSVRALAGVRRLLVLCGRYEGIDERVHLHLAHEEISVGDVVLAGGEVAATVLIEAVTRLVPGVMGNAASGADESFSDASLEHPHYTRPESVRGYGVPDVLRSGDHGRIGEWRRGQARTRTRLVRPDLAVTEASGRR